MELGCGQKRLHRAGCARARQLQCDQTPPAWRERAVLLRQLQALAMARAATAKLRLWLAGWR